MKPGATLIEATSGNTRMSVAGLAAIKGYQAILVMSDIQSRERRRILRALGAEIVLTPAEEGTAGTRQRLKCILVDNPEFCYVGQHVNPSNPLAHYQTTGPELWADSDRKSDVLVAGLGTSGTLSGAGKFLKEKKPEVQLIAIKPKNSPFISQGIIDPNRIMGTAPGFVPETFDKEVLDEYFLASADEAFAAYRDIAEKEGLLVVITSGASAYAARQLANQPENAGKVIVCIFADASERYLSVEGLFY